MTKDSAKPALFLRDPRKTVEVGLGVSPESEGRYADQKRGDIKFVSGLINIPAEVKTHMHRKLWTSISGQLIPRYMRDPGTGGLGIFIVFWFGIEAGSTPKPSTGIIEPQDAEQLRRALAETIPTEHRGRIEVICFDVSVRSKKQKKTRRQSRKATRITQ